MTDASALGPYAAPCQNRVMHLATVAERLRNARHVVCLTGAGVSAESGIPTFRDPQTGLWARFDPLELATLEAFDAHPAWVWGWYEWRRCLVARAAPNPAHCALAAIAGRVPRFTLVTQNVDDLHERAGSHDVLHLHGRLADSRCELCGRRLEAAPRPDVPEGGAPLDPPRCPDCGGRYRPGVVWFGEALPPDVWLAAAQAAGDCDLFFCIGTSSRVQPAASLSEIALQAGATTVQINPAATGLDEQMSALLRGPAGQILPQLVAAAWP